MAGNEQRPGRRIRIGSWNLNGLRSAVRHGFVEVVRRCEPDVLLLQEVKSAEARRLLEPLSDTYALTTRPCGMAGRSGVAVFTKGVHDPVHLVLDHAGLDAEGRLVAVEFRRVQYWCCAVPSGSSDKSRLALKQEYLDRLLSRAIEHASARVVLGGDLNVAHLVLDIEGGQGPRRPGFLPDERAVLDEMGRAGWVDLVRRAHGEEPGPFTWRSRTRGWRIDHVWASPGSGLVASAVAVDVGRPVSDHRLLLVDVVDTARAST